MMFVSLLRCPVMCTHGGAACSAKSKPRKLENMKHMGGFPKLGVPTIMENQMEKKMENEMETAFIQGIIGIRVFQN